MKLEAGEHYLVTTYDWFYAPDGRKYKAVYGPVEIVPIDKDNLGFGVARGSEPWCLKVGVASIPGCEVKFAVQCTEPAYFGRVEETVYDRSGAGICVRDSEIFDARTSVMPPAAPDATQEAAQAARPPRSPSPSEASTATASPLEARS